ncbi:MAG: phosphate ABC transporter ATP-binding protein [Thaumarchaeota archaeon]|nr:phosphate ABC transporter ATP-binding protein [Nitrososphaerota archaeon]
MQVKKTLLRRALEYKPILKSEKLNVWYGRVHALKDVDVIIPSKRITAIMGPSGCGKSTLLKAFNRLLEVEGARVEGKVYFHDVDIYSDSVDPYTIRRKIGMVFQKPIPLPMSIYDNVAYGLRVNGVKDKRLLDEVVRENLEKVGLWDEVKDRLRDSAFNLSGGQQQRLCIARALAVEPEVILLDEPTSSLDPASTKRIEELLKRLSGDYTIVIVTHNVHQAMRLAERVVFIFEGRIVEQGDAEEIFKNPRSILTKAYIKGDFS